MELSVFIDVNAPTSNDVSKAAFTLFSLPVFASSLAAVNTPNTLLNTTLKILFISAPPKNIQPTTAFL